MTQQEQLTARFPHLIPVAEGKETLWCSPYYLPFDMVKGLCQLVVSPEEIQAAAQRLERFRPYLRAVFPDTRETDGLIESPLEAIPEMQAALAERAGTALPGKMLLKLDSHLAAAGSVKARGGIYEVLKHAETLALSQGLLTEQASYDLLCGEEAKKFFSQYTIQVGSTGNLGLSIGIMGAALGFRVVVHMSADAKEWKKELLRQKGVIVREYPDDYSKAVQEGRKQSDADPYSYFIDDERSKDLFLGYAVAAQRLDRQLRSRGITVDGEHPLFVYLPAGVGGAPGGISYGLKQIYGDHVHCFFAEPTACPSVLLGVASQQFEKISVYDLGLSGKTDADGLACASPSGFVTRIMTNLLSGVVTTEDARLYADLKLLHETESILIEPSSCAAFRGPEAVLATEEGRAYCSQHSISARQLENSTHIIWATGGRLVPQPIWQEYLAKAGSDQ